MRNFQRINGMKKLATWLGVAAMFSVLLTAPLFHFHEHDDHENTAAVLHAHFAESPEVDHHSEPELESPHSHANARWIDFFVCKAPSASCGLAIDFAEELLTPILEVQEPIHIASIPQAHGPPGAAPSRPRSPPSIEHA